MNPPSTSCAPTSKEIGLRASLDRGCAPGAYCAICAGHTSVRTPSFTSVAQMSWSVLPIVRPMSYHTIRSDWPIASRPECATSRSTICVFTWWVAPRARLHRHQLLRSAGCAMAATWGQGFVWGRAQGRRSSRIAPVQLVGMGSVSAGTAQHSGEVQLIGRSVDDYREWHCHARRRVEREFCRRSRARDGAGDARRSRGARLSLTGRCSTISSGPRGTMRTSDWRLSTHRAKPGWHGRRPPCSNRSAAPTR